MTPTRFLLAALALGPATLTVTLAGCDPGTVVGTDTPGTDTPVVDCESDAACDDGQFCNGTETCSEGRCVAGTTVTCDDGIACTTDSCSETRRACVAAVPDADGDGFGVAGCGDGTDCDDTDENRFPGNAEVCNDVDEDCDPTTLGGFDFDADGFVSDACCNDDASGTPVCGQDCDDNRATTFPGALEVCDTLDQDCDGTADDGVDLDGFVDGDLDGVGGATSMRACAGAPRFATVGGDCDDANPLRYPGAPELCDLMENDCDAETDETPVFVLWYPDTDGDTFGTTDASLAVRSCAPIEDASTRGTDCNDTDPAIHPAAAEACDGVDNNCNGLMDFRVGGRANDWEDDDRDGLLDAGCTGVGTDCDDTNPVVGGGSPELCDGADNDCDTMVDEGVLSTPYYRDVDGDGYGSVASGAVNACVQPPGFSVRGGDCADAVATRNPSAREVCNIADDDCDSAIDESCVSDCTNPTEVRCGTGGCIDPRLDERYCGASLSCTGRDAGELCGTGELCSGAECAGVFMSPNGERLPWSPPDATVEFVLDFADAPFSEGFSLAYYTTDGSRPGISPTTIVGSPPTTVTLADGETLRWFLEIDGFRTPEQRYTHRRNAGSARDMGFVPGALALLISGQDRGPAIVANPGDTIEVHAPARVWRSDATGYCPGCIIQYVVSVDGIGAIGCEPFDGGTYPGNGFGSSPVFVTAPTTPGIYPVRANITLEGGCMTPVSSHPTGNGLMIGWIVVRPGLPAK